MARARDSVAEVERAVRALPRSKPSAEMWAAKNYVGAGESKCEFLDVRTGVRRERFKQGFSFGGPPKRMSAAELDRAWREWDRVWWGAKTFEAMCCALEFAASCGDAELVRRARTLIAWLKRSDNWALSDSLSSLYARVFEASPRTLSPWLEKWSRSNNPWERRQSLVSLLYYSSARGSHAHAPLPTILRYVGRALDDDHYFVQKGVGWAIREAYNVYPAQMLAWIRRNAARIHPAAWHATTEKLDAATKARLKKIRAARAKSSRASR